MDGFQTGQEWRITEPPAGIEPASFTLEVNAGPLGYGGEMKGGSPRPSFTSRRGRRSFPEAAHPAQHHEP